MKNDQINRREFLLKTGKVAAIGALALSAFDVTKLLAMSDKLEYFAEGIARTFNLSDYPSLANVGGYAMVTDKVIVIRKSRSNFAAFNITCTHKKCDVDYNGSSFECPCHGSTYDGNGKVTEGPATKNLKKYKVTYDADSNSITINI